MCPSWDEMDTRKSNIKRRYVLYEQTKKGAQFQMALCGALSWLGWRYGKWSGGRGSRGLPRSFAEIMSSWGLGGSWRPELGSHYKMVQLACFIFVTQKIQVLLVSKYPKRRHKIVSMLWHSWHWDEWKSQVSKPTHRIGCRLKEQRCPAGADKAEPIKQWELRLDRTCFVGFVLFCKSCSFLKLWYLGPWNFLSSNWPPATSAATAAGPRRPEYQVLFSLSDTIALLCRTKNVFSKQPI